MKNMAGYEKDVLKNVGDAFDGKTAPRFLKQARRHLTVDSSAGYLVTEEK